MMAQVFLNQQVQLVAASYHGTEGSLPVAGGEFVFLDAQGNTVTMNGSPGPFLSGDTPTNLGGNNLEGVAYLPIDFTQAELNSITEVEFYVFDELDQFSAPFAGIFQSPDEMLAGGDCDPRQGINVCEANLTCFSDDPNDPATCQ